MGWEAMKEQEGARRHQAGVAAVRILSNHFDAARPRGELYFEIMEVILDAMLAANEELSESRFTPRCN
jgi:hypothetical protein